MNSISNRLVGRGIEMIGSLCLGRLGLGFWLDYQQSITRSDIEVDLSSKDVGER